MATLKNTSKSSVILNCVEKPFLFPFFLIIHFIELIKQKMKQIRTEAREIKMGRIVLALRDRYTLFFLSKYE